MVRLRGAALDCATIIGSAVTLESGLFNADAAAIMGFVMKIFGNAAGGAGHAAPTGEPPPVPFDKLHNACARICRIVGAEFLTFLPAILPPLLKQVRDGMRWDGMGWDGMRWERDMRLFWRGFKIYNKQ